MGYSVGDDEGILEGTLLGALVIRLGSDDGLEVGAPVVGVAVVGFSVIRDGSADGVSVGAADVGLSVGGGGGTPSKTSFGSMRFDGPKLPMFGTTFSIANSGTPTQAATVLKMASLEKKVEVWSVWKW